MKLDLKKIRSGELRIQYYPDYLPFPIRFSMSAKQKRIWKSTLKKYGNYNKVYTKLARRRDLRKRGEITSKDDEKELFDWLKLNPEYKSVIKEY